ncbi:hypothetical protein PFISCL1PPCAC_26703, partial [Pristionchus fissidentatus]
ATMYLRLPIFCFLFLAKVSAAPTPKDVLFEVEEMLLRNVNFSADPCDDFHNYACGKWIATSEIPQGEETVFAGSNLMRKINRLQREAIESISDSSSSISEIKLKNFYGKCIDTEILDRNDNMEMIFELKELGPFPMMRENFSTIHPFDFTNMIVRIEALGGHSFVEAGFAFDHQSEKLFLKIDILPVTVEDISLHNYLTKASEYPEKVDAYRQYLIKKAMFISQKYNSAATLEGIKFDVEEVLKFAANMASILTRCENDDEKKYTPKKLSELQKIFPVLNWNRYLKSISPSDVHNFFDSDPTISIYEHELRALKEIALLIVQSNYSTIANFMFLQFTDSYNLSYDQKMRTITEEMIRKIGGPFRERWELCVNRAERMLSHAYGALYVNKYFPKTLKKELLEIIEQIKEAMRTVIEREKWMDNETKKAALRKLNKMDYFAGNRDWILNDHLLDEYYTKLHFSREDSFHRIMRTISTWKQERKFRMLAKKGKADREEFVRGSEPAVSAVNAFYSSLENKFIMNAAMINPPYYYAQFPKAINFGAIGSIIGHEISHGFDPSGASINEDGIWRNWWDHSTKEEFNKRVQCIFKQYNNETDPVDGINMKHQQDEIVADLGGLKAAYQAYQTFIAQNGPEPRLPSFPEISNDHLFFLGFGQELCSKETKQYLTEKQAHDRHPPNKFRLLLSTRNNPEFAKAFNCPSGSKMNPVKQCVVW